MINGVYYYICKLLITFDAMKVYPARTTSQITIDFIF